MVQWRSGAPLGPAPGSRNRWAQLPSCCQLAAAWLTQCVAGLKLVHKASVQAISSAALEQSWAVVMSQLAADTCAQQLSAGRCLLTHLFAGLRRLTQSNTGAQEQ